MNAILDFPKLKVMATSDEKTLTISQNSVISLSLAVTMLGAIVFDQVQFAEVKSIVKQNEISLQRLDQRQTGFENNYISKENWELRMENLNLKLESIELKIEQLNR